MTSDVSELIMNFGETTKKDSLIQTGPVTFVYNLSGNKVKPRIDPQNYVPNIDLTLKIKVGYHDTLTQPKIKWNGG